MKKYIFLLILFVMQNSYAFEWNYEYESKAMSNLNNIAFSGDTLLTYGTNGVIMYSFDKGHNWFQANLPEENNIQYLQSTHSGYYGFSKSNFIWTQDKTLKTWNTIEFPIIFDDNFYTNVISTYSRNDKNYILLSNNVYIATEDFEVQEESIFPSGDDYFFLNMFGKGDSLFVLREDNKLFILNLLTKEFEEKDIDLPEDCNMCKIKDEITNFGETIYLKSTENRNEKIIFSNNFGDSWQNFSSQQEFPNNINMNNMILENDKLFTLGIERLFRGGDRGGDINSNRIDSLNGTFNPLRHRFRFASLDSSAVFNIVSDTNDYIPHLRGGFQTNYNKIQKIDSNTIIAIMDFKRIYISYNNGKNWEINSYGFDFVPQQTFKLDKFGSLFSIGGIDFFKSTNSGVTWLPQTIGETDLTPLYYDYRHHSESSKYLVSLVLQDRTPSGGTSEYLLAKYNKSDNTISYSFPFIDFKLSPRISRLLHKFEANINGNILWGLTYFTPDNINSSVHFINFDEDFELQNLSNVDSVEIMGLEFIDDKIYAFFKNYKMPFYNGTRTIFSDSTVSLMSSTDFGKTWETEIDDIGPAHFFRTSTLNDNLIFNQTYFGSKFLSSYNTKTKEKRTIEISESLASFFIGSGYSFIDSTLIGFKTGSYIYYVADIKSPFTTWDSLYFDEEDKFFFIKNHLNQILYNGQDLYFYLNLHIVGNDPIVGLYKAIPKTPSSVENAETETPRSRAYLHAGKPYPLPAVSTVSADLHWNAQYSAQEAVLKVFDSMGNEIPNANVELQQTNPYSGTVTWDCGTYPTGVYFIQVTIGTEQKNVGVAVVR